MKKLIIFLILTTLFIISCGSSKKAENDTDILPDEDSNNDEEAVENVEDENDEEAGELNDTDEDELEDIDPCDPNPCAGLENSTEECIADADKYSCGCVDNYFWDGVKCVNPCEGIDCTKFEHATGLCKPNNAFSFSCNCDKGYFFWRWEDKKCLAKEPTAVNICTGQTKCYDNEKEIACPAEGEEFFGQDANYAKLEYCIPQSFSIDNSVEDEPVVIDNNLGLMWQRKIPPLEERYVKDVLQYCEDLVYGGYSDWRLPTVEDFMTIADYGRYDPAVDTEYFPDSGEFWTASNSKGFSYYAMYEEYYTIFDFTIPSTKSARTYGSSAGGYPGNSYPYTFNIRCVRGNDSAASEYYSMPETLGENLMWSDGTLIVMRKTDMNYTWSEALKYCQELDYAGIPYWRLPNIKEFRLSAGDIFLRKGYVRTSTTKIFDQTSEHLVSGKEQAVQGSIFCVTSNPCSKGTFWNGVKCVKNPCDPNPCGSEDALNRTCKVIDEETYFCGCSKCMYYEEHTSGKCYEGVMSGPYCVCEEGYSWNFENGECQ